jgi:DNA-binding XRE family transcriptional regulator
MSEFTVELRSADGTNANARLVGEIEIMKSTNFDRYLKEQLQDPAFAARFERAGEAWEVALQIAALREQAGISQKELAKRLKTSQQQVSRLESPGYEGHSLGTLRRIADVLDADVRVVFQRRTVTQLKKTQIRKAKPTISAQRVKAKRA